MAKSPPSFERISHLGELLIVIFYAEAYREAVTNFLHAYNCSGLSRGPVPLFVIFFTVTVRFFVGNHLHLADERWNKDFPHADCEAKTEENESEEEKKPRWTLYLNTRKLYYIDALAIVGESLAMILLGGLATVGASAKLLLGLLIFISSIDVFWIAVQSFLDMIFKRWPGKIGRTMPFAKFRPCSPLNQWLSLNAILIIVFAYCLSCSWGQPLSVRLLWAIAAINFVAFIVDMCIFNVYHA